MFSDQEGFSLTATTLQNRLAFVASLEKAKLLTGVYITAFKADCPFCGIQGNFIIYLHQETSRYSCTACGEAGILGEIGENLAAIRPVPKKFRRIQYEKNTGK